MNDFWNKHSAHYLEMAFRTDRFESITNPDGYGKNTGECGDTIEMFLTLRNERIQWVSFATDGCMNTRACANTVAEMAEKKTLENAWKIKTENVISYLETLPEESFHCAELAVGALYLALTNARMNQKNSWKKLYQKNASK
ncbi:MAG: iron-sulfur cluster assembly scaffold protein [Desulfobacteraceae bacterium]|nr:iron-sulfur cluster assembly scaffold protein [Desulfobacteraceae bacterium]